VTRFVRAFAAIPLALTVLGACRGGRSEADTTVAAGDAGAIEVDALNYEVTPERYQRWVAAQGALDAIQGLREPPTLDPARFSEADVNRAVQYLESDPRSRAALARAGVSARDYVLTTLALDQALVAATAPSASAAAGASAPSRGGAGAAASGARAAERASTTTAAPTATPARTRTRYRNLPPRNSELVERNRDDIARVRSGSRFRIVKERVDTATAEGAVDRVVPTRVVPAGTTIALRSDARVCGTTHKVGSRVTGTVTSPVSGTNGVAIPAGASASLSVVGTPRAGTPMEFTLNSISVDGQTYPVAGTGVASRVDRVRLGSTSKDVQKVAGGAVVGAVAGQVLGKDTKSTVIGAAVGAAAGAAAANASARYDVCVPAGAPIQVTLRDALNLRV
jgi:YmgG-like glycine-zipper protein